MRIIVRTKRQKKENNKLKSFEFSTIGEHPTHCHDIDIEQRERVLN